ncbi:hypothetical protein CcaverHIS002_0602460 [Cutaneotrichosporon cavernicola]|uniref:Uncharacterized protein n=1 Tax=Cutaneotrichosporon cavernicola TaxID=279322 RepID=A0AA48QXU2_9TREE|nr:uncharacterized protein CcaverHIS019_0601950 [Cutaneotrichosporon cavernicola]BEI85959.1 hypothetical protein CcaverHIS002_0602460 [Cutaneotrichosporon cavernicola]BEI93736.1 hypothetical protein CcaverHIS019_0601950 [Cutaneotrichosporon cavernicola]BEJ01514.1 hypothetical protein CcaverHIS631_0601960 [Cutaneotrichosporon cavernicola]BEJ09279.1 hypothetical protein CcaverHIS641_0601940 [Cutaneotrichosporon cavernicola]
MSTQTEAQRRAAARKAKILARGNAGLARLAQTARGEEADKLYGDDLRSSPAGSAPSSRPETPVQSEPSSAPRQPASATAAPQPASPTSPTSSKPGWANTTPGPPTPATRAAAADPTNLPGMGRDEMPDFNAFMQQMMAGMGPGGPGGQGFPALAGPGGEGADPFGGQDPFAALMAQMGGGGGDGQNPFAGMPPGMMPPGMMPGMGMPGMGMAPVPPSKTQRLLPLIHALAVIAFTIFVVVWWEPTMQLVRAGGLGVEWSARWKGLGGRAGGYVAKTFGHLPVFYAFSTLEAMLLAFRVVIVKPQPRLHPLLANVLPMLPLNIQRIVVTGSKYLGVVGQTYADACLFIFGLGCAVVIAEYL